ncbi:MAG: aminomethyl transferase family protein [Proteobacteria bacterium]|nr:MAG: aminomethyl transferase family protein [Pseudomonadota bacterium]
MTAAPCVPRLLTTPFHERTSACCQTHDYANWAGYATVQAYTNVDLEYFAARNTAALFDLSPMTKYDITGADAERYLNRLLTRDVRKIDNGRVSYVAWCDDDGMLIDDGTLFRFAADRFRLCSQERHLPWLLDSAVGFDVGIRDVTGDVAALALQGPTSFAVLKMAGLSAAERLRPFDMAAFTLGNASLYLSRTGFTGDLGYELWLDPADAIGVWDALTEAGRLYGITPMGSQALDMTRIEAGFIQANVDFLAGGRPTRRHRLRSPFELGLDRLVDFDKGHFNGRRALLSERDNGTRRFRLVALDVEGNKPARDALLYDRRDREVGVVTSAMWSPTCKRSIALASIRRDVETGDEGLWADIYVQRELKWRRTKAACRAVRRPFFNPARRRATPPGDY